jgi:hypothetical protein
MFSVIDVFAWPSRRETAAPLRIGGRPNGDRRVLALPAGETAVDRAIREEGEGLRNVCPWLDERQRDYDRHPELSANDANYE